MRSLGRDSVLLIAGVIVALARPSSAWALRTSQETAEPAALALILNGGLEEGDPPLLERSLWGKKANDAFQTLIARLGDQHLAVSTDHGLMIVRILTDPALWESLARWIASSPDWAAVAASLRQGIAVPIGWGLSLTPAGADGGAVRLIAPEPDLHQPHEIYARLARDIFGAEHYGVLQLRLGPDSDWLRNHHADGLLEFLRDRRLTIMLEVPWADQTARRQLERLLDPRVLCRMIPANRPIGSRAVPAQLQYPGVELTSRFRGCLESPNGNGPVFHLQAAPGWVREPSPFVSVSAFLQAHPAARSAAAQRGIGERDALTVWVFPPAHLLNDQAAARAISVYWSSEWPALKPDLERALESTVFQDLNVRLAGDAAFGMADGFDMPALLVRLAQRDTPIPPTFPGAVVTLSHVGQWASFDPAHLAALASWQPLLGGQSVGSVGVITWDEAGERFFAAFV